MSSQTKTFTIKIVQITSPTSLPNATQYSSYTYTLLSAGTTGTTSWVHVSGSFPTGLLLDLATGVLSSDVGGITEAGDFSFTLRIKDGSGVECDKAFTLHVTAAIGLVAYWTYDDYDTSGPDDLLLDSTANNNDLLISDPYNVVAGKVGNCMSTFENYCQTFALGDFDNVGTTGFTICGWIKFSFDQSGQITIWGSAWTGFTITLEFNINELHLYRTTGGFAEVFVAYPPDGDWHFYRSWLDVDGRLKLQLDGGSIFQSGAAVFPDTACNLFQLQGDTTASPDNLNGFDETGFWKRVLSNAEAAQLWNSGNGTTWPAVPP